MSPSSDDEQNWILFRERSLQPGGFGEDRARIWPALLGAQPLSDPPPYSEVDSTNEASPMEDGTDGPVTDPHADEHQIKLDTDRSFVLYGESSATPTRDTLQNGLHELLVSLFRKRRSLHYFQGFHDIMTVIFLTLPQPLHLACAEKMALHRVRDSMGVGLEPVLGLLRVLRNLLRLVDPAYAKLLESISPLPYHALSHLLTLFSHDVPTLPLIQHVWDFLLSREPIAVVWLAAAHILHRKHSVYLLAEQDEEGMIHSLLGGIPELVDTEPDFHDPGKNQSTVTESDCDTEDETDSGRSVLKSGSDSGGAGADEQTSFEVANETPELPHVPCDTLTRDEDELHQSPFPSDVAEGSGMSQANTCFPSTKIISLPEVTDRNLIGAPRDSILELATSIPLPDSQPPSPSLSTGLCSLHSGISLSQETTPFGDHNPLSPTSDHVPSRSHSSSDVTRASSMQSHSVTTSSPPHLKMSAPSKPRTRSLPLSLTHLLRQADDLLAAYPPSHPLLHVTEIMGPDSVMRTWRPLPVSTKARDAVPEKPSYDYSDDYLETLVSSSYIVIPSPPPSPPPGRRLPAKKTKASPRALSKALLDPRSISQRLSALTIAERRVLFIGALLVVGAAMALKSARLPCVDGIIKPGGGDGLKRLWNGKWTLVSSVIAAWGRGLP